MKELNTNKFFRKLDWVAGWITFAIALGLYVYTLQPTVGLEDSGELIVASDYLGVPHAPGYPIWSFFTWLFQWVFHGVTFHGHPNPAWAVNLFSAVTGALACGVIALLISRSGMDMLRSFKKETEILGEKTEQILCAVSGIMGGLLLAFSHGMWSQAVIAEVYAFNVLFQSLVLLFLYRWLAEKPQNHKWLFLCLFTFGLGITNHQTLMFMGPAIAVAILLNDIKMFSFKNLWQLSTAVFGLILTAVAAYLHLPSIVVLSVLICIVALLFIKEDFLARDFIIVGSIFIILVGFNMWATAPLEANESIEIFKARMKWSWVSGPKFPGFWLWSSFAVLIPLIATFTLKQGKIVGPVFLLLLLGTAFYFYMPISSDQNPPINWAYPRTWKGFIHAITRGQYEQVKLASIFEPKFLIQLQIYLTDLRGQFYSIIALFAFIPFVSIPFFFLKKRRVLEMGKDGSPMPNQDKENSDRSSIALNWLFTTLVAFIVVGIVFIIMQNPKTDLQSLFIGQVQYIQSHAIYVFWIAYGVLFLTAWLQTLLKNNPATLWLGVVFMLLLPFSLLYKNNTDVYQQKVYGHIGQRGHDFGWQYGNWQLQGVKGIEEDLRAIYSPEEFEKIWAAYPNKNYPQPMGINAIFFGGTDPGRFVPTYMIYSAHVRPDVYLITQNALADDTYMKTMRDLYGNQIWIPSDQDANTEFAKFIRAVELGKINPGASVTKINGKWQVHGVMGVMKINALDCKIIFDNNQYRTETKTDEATRSKGSAVVYQDPKIDPKTGKPPLRSFYLEESYPMQWMYPYLTPHGLIMKLNNKPTPLTDEIVKNDTDFWNWYTKRLVADKNFMHDVPAQRAFCKLRGSIASLYQHRGRLKEAEAAYKQALELYPQSQEVVFKLVQFLAMKNRFNEAMNLLQRYLKEDKNSLSAKKMLNRLFAIQKIQTQTNQLEQKHKASKLTSKEELSLILLYLQSGRKKHAEKYALHLLSSKKIYPKQAFLIAQLMAQGHSYAVVEVALKKYIQLVPKDPQGWVNLAGIQVFLKKKNEVFFSLDQAIRLGGEPVRDQLRKNKQFDPIRNTPEFKKRVYSNQMEPLNPQTPLIPFLP